MRSSSLARAYLLAIPLSLLSSFALSLPERDLWPQMPSDWRAQRLLVDLHTHLDFTPEHLAHAIRILDAAGIGLAVNLSGGYVTHPPGELSEFEKNKQLADQLFPGRFLLYMNLDYARWDDADFPQRAVEQINEGYRLGAAGFKEYKRLGLYLRDQKGQLLRIDDPKLDPVWERCGELGLPISIHVADPKAFWRSYDDTNERWKELKDHKSWWFGDPKQFPPHPELLEALNRVIARHPRTTFVCVHFANNAEDLDWVDRALDQFPNMRADLAARIPEIGRHDPDQVRRLFLKHQDRIFFATDFQVYEQLTLGSGGSGPAPDDSDAAEFFAKHWRWLETNDRNFSHMTPIQGDWTISGIGLPRSALRKIYFDNARQLLARSWPAPELTVRRISSDFALSGMLADPAWAKAVPARIEAESFSGHVRPEWSTTLRALRSDRFLYLGFVAPFSELTVFEPAQFTKERIGLWEKDVVEAFIGTDPSQRAVYKELEVAPTGEKLDLSLAPDAKRFDWESGFEAAVHIDGAKKFWVAEWRIPLRAFQEAPPRAGDLWPANFYRVDKANHAYLAWNPTLARTFHNPARFGRLRFE